MDLCNTLGGRLVRGTTRPACPPAPLKVEGPQNGQGREENLVRSFSLELDDRVYRMPGVLPRHPEGDALRHFVSDRCVSPAFVQRLVREHGAASLLETFHLPDQALAFLLRCHKGRFYRNRYPTLSLVQGGES